MRFFKTLIFVAFCLVCVKANGDGDNLELFEEGNDRYKISGYKRMSPPVNSTKLPRPPRPPRPPSPDTVVLPVVVPTTNGKRNFKQTYCFKFLCHGA